MNLFQLKYAIMAAEYNSISKAAEKLYTSQASCSNAITNLEKDLKINIFNRSNKGVTLTKEGEIFISQAKIIINQTKILEQIGGLYIEEPQPLKISCHRLLFVSHIIIQIYDLFKDKDLRISLNEVTRETVINDIKDKKSNIGLLALNSVEYKFWKYIIELNGLQFNEIRKEKLYIYVGKNNPLYNNDLITYDELKNLPGIFLPERFNLTKYHNIPNNEMLLEGGKKSLYLNDKDTIIKVIRKTNAFAIGMKLNDEENPEGLKGIPLEKDDIYFTLGWIKTNDESLSKEEQAFINLI